MKKYIVRKNHLLRSKHLKINNKKMALRNPPADEDGYCNEKQPYYLDGCCYSGEKDTKGNVREFKVRGTTLSKKTKSKKNQKIY